MTGYIAIKEFSLDLQFEPQKDDRVLSEDGTFYVVQNRYIFKQDLFIIVMKQRELSFNVQE
jgi:hypothetical protein